MRYYDNQTKTSELKVINNSKCVMLLLYYRQYNNNIINYNKIVYAVQTQNHKHPFNLYWM